MVIINVCFIPLKKERIVWGPPIYRKYSAVDVNKKSQQKILDESDTSPKTIPKLIPEQAKLSAVQAVELNNKNSTNKNGQPPMKGYKDFNQLQAEMKQREKELKKKRKAKKITSNNSASSNNNSNNNSNTNSLSIKAENKTSSSEREATLPKARSITENSEGIFHNSL